MLKKKKEKKEEKKKNKSDYKMAERNPLPLLAWLFMRVNNNKNKLNYKEATNHY